MLEQPRILYLQPAIDASRIYHQRTASVETTNRSFLDVIFMAEKTLWGRFKKGILMHPDTSNI